MARTLHPLIYIGGLLFALITLYAFSRHSSYAATFQSTMSHLQAPARDCSKGLHIIAAKGHEPIGGPYGRGLIALVDEMKTRIPHSSSYALPYPNEDEDVGAAAGVGVDMLKKEITAYVDACPDAKVALMGYSLGAIVVMATLCGGEAPIQVSEPLEEKYAKNIVAAISYGSGVRVMGREYNAGTCHEADSMFPAKGATCGPFSHVIQDYCDSPDPVCCVGGKNDTIHSLYHTLYDEKAAEFIASKYDEL